MAALSRIGAGADEAAPIDVMPEAWSQSVLGSAPMNENSSRTSRRVSAPLARSRQVTAASCPPSPSSAETSAPVTISTLARPEIRSIRYCDIVSSSGRRTIKVIRLANSAR